MPVKAYLDLILAFGWLAGIAVQQILAAPVSQSWIGFGLLLLAGVYRFFCPASMTFLKAVVAGLLTFSLGLCWASWNADRVISGKLDSALNRSRCIVQGSVEQVGQRTPKLVRFTILVTELDCGPSKTAANPKTSRLRLTWYLPTAEIRPGQRWRLNVRLKRPHGFANPGLFDYGRWLALRGIGATGYVMSSPTPERLQEASWSVDGIRDQLLLQLNRQLGDHPQSPIIAALALGDRSRIRDQQWQIIRDSGTSHLLAISGLHIGLVGAFCWWLGARLWRLQSRWLLRLPAPMVGALSGWAGAFGYALISGLAVPAQRALIMFTVIAIGGLMRRELINRRSYLLALVLVLIWQPMAVLQPGFWLSFGALLLIWWALLGRSRRPVEVTSPESVDGGSGFSVFIQGFTEQLTAWAGWLVRLTQIQFVLWLGLLPLGLLFFDQFSWVAMPANLVAIPVVTLLVLPLTLLGTLLMVIFQSLGGALLWLAAEVMDWLWLFLEWLVVSASFLQTMPWQVPAQSSLLVVFVALVGGFWLTAPRGFPARWLGIGCLLPILTLGSGFNLPFSTEAEQGHFSVQVVDVGQGLAVIVTTAHHTLVYDTGARFSERFDSGADLIRPLLRGQGRDQIDRLVISHGDSDHAGGLVGLLRSVSVKNLCSGTVEQLPVNNGWQVDWPKPVACASGGKWLWDGVQFEFLHQPHSETTTDNDRSSVLRIGGKTGLLLTGDISAAAEQRLINGLAGADEPERLSAQVMLVPHHGSRHSSSHRFLKKVKPVLAIVSSGYANRFNHPHPLTVERYQVAGIELINTAVQGAITLNFNEIGLIGWQGYRSAAERYWY